MAISFTPPNPRHLSCNRWKRAMYNYIQQHLAKLSFEQIAETADFIKSKITFAPMVGIICGSGLGSLGDSVESPVIIPYNEIPNFPVSTVQGHEGTIILGYLNKVPVAVINGRFHHYEGYPIAKCSMPVQVLKLLGCSHLIVSNTAGGINPEYKVGDVMIIKDHINILGLSGKNPLQGPNEDRWGPRFPPMNRAYNTLLRQRAKKIAQYIGLTDFLHEGVYACVSGPAYETIAEIKMLQLCGADAVGMSTVPEVITAVHCGMIVFGFSLITNEAVTDYDSEVIANHLEVLATAKSREYILQRFVTEIVMHIENEYKHNKCQQLFLAHGVC